MHVSRVPAVDQNRVVPRVSLYVLDPVNEGGDGKVIGTLAIRQPAGDMELSHRQTLTGLQKGGATLDNNIPGSDMDYNYSLSNLSQSCSDKQ